MENSFLKKRSHYCKDQVSISGRLLHSFFRSQGLTMLLEKKKKKIYMANRVVQVFVVNQGTCHESSLWKQFSN